jgi:hypothetical protein
LLSLMMKPTAWSRWKRQPAPSGVQQLLTDIAARVAGCANETLLGQVGGRSAHSAFAAAVIAPRRGCGFPPPPVPA